VLAGPKFSWLYLDPLCHIAYCDADIDRRFVFLNNNFNQPALTITRFYKSTQQVELFFKWVKQYLHTKAFYGASGKAVHLWVAIGVCMLEAIVKKELGMERGLNEILQILRLALLEKIPVFRVLSERKRGLPIVIVLTK
jgi:hypothetical protein